MKVPHIIITLITLLTIASCSGGGGDSTPPTDPNTTFNLFPSNFLSVGYSESYTLTGTDTAGGTHQGNYSLQTLVQSTFNGEAAIPISVQLNWTNTQTGAFISVPVTAYYSTSLASLRSLGSDDLLNGITTVSANTSIIPQTVKIGDFGNVGTYTDSAGNTQAVSWRTTDAGNNKINFIVMSSIKDQTGAIIGTTESTIVNDANGNRSRITLKVFFATQGITLTLSGT